MPGSRLLPPERRSPLPAAPTTSRWWRTHVLLRSWLNRHRHRWLAPLLLCAPPVGVAMVWAGASRPGHARRWLTAAALVWSLVVLLTVVLVTSPSATPADAGAAPRLDAAGTTPATPSPSATATRDDASAAAVVRGGPVRSAGVDSVAVAAPTDPPDSGDRSAAGGGAPAASSAVPSAASTGPAPTSSTPRRSATPTPPRATPTPTPPPRRTPTREPDPPSLPTANPFTPCAVEGAHAVSPNGFPLRCSRTPIGLYWLWGK